MRWELQVRHNHRERRQPEWKTKKRMMRREKKKTTRSEERVVEKDDK